MNITNADIAAAKDCQAALDELICICHLQTNDLTERQLAEAIRQAIACGDFQKLVVTTGGGAQQVVYIPFSEHARLRARIRELEARQVRCEVCGEYLPGHATGGLDICTCK